MAGTLTAPVVKATSPATNGHRSPVEPKPIPIACDTCAKIFGKGECQRKHVNIHRLHILEDFVLDGSHIIYIAHAHIESAQVYSFAVLAILDEQTYIDPMKAAVTAIAHLGGSIA